MKFWNFSHFTAHLHVYVLLAIVLLIAMFVIAYVHDKKQQRREEKHEDELRNIKSELIEGKTIGKDAGLEEDGKI